MSSRGCRSSCADRLRDSRRRIRISQVAIVLGDLVFEDQARSECLPGQVGDEPVVLVSIVAAVGQDQVWFRLALEVLELILDIGSRQREVAISPGSDDDLLVRHALEHHTSPGTSLLGARGVPGADDPPDAGDEIVRHQPKDRPTAADLDVVGMGPDDEDVEGARRPGRKDSRRTSGPTVRSWALGPRRSVARRPTAVDRPRRAPRGSACPSGCPSAPRSLRSG